MYKITLYDMNCSPIADGTVCFFTENIEDFEKNWIPRNADEPEQIDRYKRSKAGECITDYYSKDPDLNIVQEDTGTRVLFEKQFLLRDVTFYATNAYDRKRQYHVDTWECVFRWIRFKNDFLRIFRYKASGVCMIDGDSLSTAYCCGNPVLINTENFVHYAFFDPLPDHPLTFADFAGNTIETYCWLTGRWFETEEDAAKDYESFTITPEIMDQMFWDVIGADG